MNQKKYDYETFDRLFANEIAYAYESFYKVRYYLNDKNKWCISFYKLDLCEDGTARYKDTSFTFDPSLWGKIKIQAELLGCKCIDSKEQLIKMLNFES